MEQWGLVPVAQVDSYAGLIFGTFDAETPPLHDYLGELTWYLDMIADRREGGIEFLGGVHKWVQTCNWKLGADNFIGDGYHVSVSHISARKAGFQGPPTQLAPPPGVQASAQHYYINTGYGNAFTTSMQSIVDGERLLPPGFKGYADECLDEAAERLGPHVRQWTPGICTIFPNLSFLPIRHTIRVWHPRGPDKMEVWSYCYADKVAPDDFKRAVLDNYQRTFGPGGALEVDDGENWDQCTSASKGYVARKQVMNYAMGIGHEQFHEHLPGWLDVNTASEHNQRGFYEHWAEMIAADSWSDLTTSFPRSRTRPG
jgi:hypothetical protein